jgi:hypothetical protein
MSVAKKPDYSIYNQLYRFDIKEELQDYNLPFAHPEDLPPAATKQPLAASKVSSLFEPSDSHSNHEEEEHEPSSSKPNYS